MLYIIGQVAGNRKTNYDWSVMKKKREFREAIWVTEQYHNGIKYLSHKTNTPIIQLTQDQLDQLFTREIGPDWREKTQMDN